MDGWMDALQLGAGGWGACMMDAHGHGHAHAPPVGWPERRHVV